MENRCSAPAGIRPSVRLLISDTGAGHRACAEAVRSAIGERARVEIVDVLVRSRAPGIRRMPEIYRWFGSHRSLWAALWHLTDSPRRARWISDPAWHLAPEAYTEIIAGGDPHAVVVLHPYLSAGTRRALRARGLRAAMVTVVTDPVTPHASWFEPEVDRVFVATAEAERRALACGMQHRQIVTVGHPIHDRVHGLARSRGRLRARYGWPEAQPVVVVAGSGDPEGIERALEALRGLAVRRVVVCGNDARMRRRLRNAPGIDELLGFVDDLPERLCAADLVLSKAGPSTLAECRAVGTPVLVTGHMPGQEAGNLAWVSNDGFGEVTAPRAAVLRASLWRWLADAPGRRVLRRRAERPQARPARSIADQIVALARRAGGDPTYGGSGIHSCDVRPTRARGENRT